VIERAVFAFAPAASFIEVLAFSFSLPRAFLPAPVSFRVTLPIFPDLALPLEFSFAEETVSLGPV
jgi:hypothetical protein